MSSNDALVLAACDPPYWAGGTRRSARYLAGKYWVTAAEALAWIYLGKPVPLWRWARELFGLPDHLPPPASQELTYFFYRGTGSAEAIMGAARQCELARQMLAANDNATEPPGGSAYAPRSGATRRLIAAGLQGEVPVIEAYRDAYARADEAEPELLTVRTYLQQALAGGHIAVSGAVSSKTIGRADTEGLVALSPLDFGPRTLITPCGMLLNDERGVVAVNVQIGVEGLCEVFPPGPIRDVDPLYLREAQWVLRLRRAKAQEAKRARGGRPTSSSYLAVRDLFLELKRAGRLEGSAPRIARTLAGVAADQGIESVPGPTAIAKWVERWLEEDSQKTSRN